MVQSRMVQGIPSTARTPRGNRLQSNTLYVNDEGTLPENPDWSSQPSDGETEAGENTVVWDGTDNRGNPVGGGIFWMQMSTHDGYVSGKRMLVLR